MPKWRRRALEIKDELEIKARRKQILEASLNYQNWAHSSDCHLLIEPHRWRCPGCFLPFYAEFRMACKLRDAITCMLKK